ncbi:MAG: PAS domain-containing sensor histidine kinase [Cyanobacteria bacterium REEB65]|nr:PAS domain-containing sensor histidine kinase [Cyanobacteria bacterium REEB65]
MPGFDPELRPSTPWLPGDSGIDQIFTAVYDAVIVADAISARIVFWNPGAQSIFGYSSREAIGQDLVQLVPDRLRAQHLAGLDHYRQTGHGAFIDAHRSLELPALRKDGSETVVEMTLSSLPGRDGGHYVLAIMRDISGRRRIEQRLAETETLVRLLLDAIVDYAIISLDKDGRILTWNKGAERLKGYRSEEILGQPMAAFYSPEDRLAGLPERSLREAAKHGRTVEEGWRMRKDGSRFWAESVITALHDPNGDLQGYAKVTRDMSTLREAQVAIAEKARLQHERLEALVQADRVKNQFLSVISHELRTPLNFIMGFGSILEDEVAGPLNPSQHEYLRKLLAGAERMLGLVNNLLDMGRMAAGKFKIEPAPTTYAAIVSEAVEALQCLAVDRKVSILTELHVPGEVVVDGRRLVQVLTNLLQNALNFTEAGGTVTLEAEVRAGEVLTRVRDTGVGIAQDDIPKLFQPFGQLDMSTTRRGEGAGLGLSICKAIVEAHHGQIGVESQPGVGSTFWFTLPRDPTSSPAPPT